MTNPTDKKPRILIVEDDLSILTGLSMSLRFEGFEVIQAQDGRTGLQKAIDERPDLLVLDVMLPQMNGFEVLEELRARGSTIPVVVLSAKGVETDRVMGLNLGADDYVVKPFGLQELLARIRSLLRRATGMVAAAPRALELGHGFSVRFDTGRAVTSEGEVTLSDKELKLMELFSRNVDKVLARADILEEVWGMDAFPTDRTIDNFILRLRRLFEPNPESPVHFVTIRGRGYLFRP